MSGHLMHSVFPDEVVSCECEIAGTHNAILPEEAACVSGAVPRRQREFAAGRLCARDALEHFGFAGFPLLMGADRAPVWPPGVVGSISHTSEFCGAAVARRGAICGIGFDVEDADDLEARLWHLILNGSERRWLEAQPRSERGALAKLIFCAKEAVYKCQYGFAGRWLEFSDVEIALDLAGRRFEPAVTWGAGGDPPAHRMQGSFLYHRGRVLTGVTAWRTEG